jgi:hypothetical protein
VVKQGALILRSGPGRGVQILFVLFVSLTFSSHSHAAGFLDRCWIEFENIFGIKPKEVSTEPILPLAGPRSPDQFVPLSDVQQALREKSLKRNIEKLKAYAAELRPKLELLRQKNLELTRLRAELSELHRAKPATAWSVIEAKRKTVEEAEAAVWAMSDVQKADRALYERWEKLMNDCPSGQCVAPRLREELIQAAGIDLSPKPYISYRTPALVEKIENSQEVPAAFVITHQVYDFTTEATIKMLREDPRFKDVPRVVLGGDEYKVNSEALYREATVVKFSSRGEFPKGLDVNAKEYHFAGGYCEACMRASINAVIGHAQKKYRSGLKFVFHADQMFWTQTETLKDRLQSALAKIDEQGTATEFARQQAIFKVIERLGNFSADTMRMTSASTDPVLTINARLQNGSTVTLQVER